ncbi:FAD-dependent monooxygenase [Paracoccus sp. MBLB3053]|uniref:FAD-dependent monooxygenase n=1 Tax=Paracoccus aurantius TaxID=3073814 RepID=A0ABU2HVE0_9RHOB|nr:FAD-dependent monooxygenase [Paracoccus sp. MBLB3053]MDS9469015.1 FAD-dependent monooxygenase [Paracoccus sp. MBLB3053]
MARSVYDAVVIGGGVAGAASALLLARAGARVLIAERQALMGEQLSTHALTRPAVELLARWGLMDTLLDQGAPLISQIRFQYASETIPIPVRPTAMVEGLIAPRRRSLNWTLLDAAVAAGADLATGTTAEACVWRNDRIAGLVLGDATGRERAVTAGLVIGADGRDSGLAEMLGAEVLARSASRSATIYGYFQNLPTDGHHWCFGKGVAAGVIPTNDGLYCVYASCRPSDYREKFGAEPLDGLTATFGGFRPVWAEQLLAGPAERLRRFNGAPGLMRRRAGKGWALVGDAACYKDPITAHGITDALLDAEALARTCLGQEGLGSYHDTRHAAAVPVFETTQQIASFDWNISGLKALHGTLHSCIRAEQSTVIASRVAAVCSSRSSAPLPVSGMCRATTARSRLEGSAIDRNAIHSPSLSFE